MNLDKYIPKESSIRFWDTPKGRVTAGIVLSLVLALVVFQAGVAVGYKKAEFSGRTGDRFFRVWGGEKGVRAAMPLPDDFIGGHGAAGRVVSVSLPTFFVATPDNLEKEVFVDSGTVVRKFRASVAASDIQPDEFVVVLGDPETDGRIRAKLVRVMPSPGFFDARIDIRQ